MYLNNAVWNKVDIFFRKNTPTILWGLECPWKLHCLWGKQRHMNPIESMNPILRQVWQNYLGSLFLECIYYFQSPSYTLTLEEDERVDCEWFIINPGHLFDHPPTSRNLLKGQSFLQTKRRHFLQEHHRNSLVRLGIFMEVSAFSSNLTINAFSFKLIFLKSLQGSSGWVGKAWDWFSCDLWWVIPQNINRSCFGPPSFLSGAGLVHACCLTICLYSPTYFIISGQYLSLCDWQELSHVHQQTWLFFSQLSNKKILPTEVSPASCFPCSWLCIWWAQLKPHLVLLKAPRLAASKVLLNVKVVQTVRNHKAREPYLW